VVVPNWHKIKIIPLRVFFDFYQTRKPGLKMKDSFPCPFEKLIGIGRRVGTNNQAKADKKQKAGGEKKH
jgi:hypothetical protein